MKQSFNVRTMTQKQLDNIALKKAGVIGQLNNDAEVVRDEDVVSLVLAGGWKCVWVRGQNSDSSGILMLKASDSRTFAILKRGNIKHWVDMGLLKPYAELLWKMRVSDRHEMVPHIVKALASPESIAAWCCHPQQHGHGTGRMKWVNQYAEKPGAMCYTGLHPKKECVLAKVVYDLVNHEIIKATKQAVKEIEIAAKVSDNARPIPQDKIGSFGSKLKMALELTATIPAQELATA